MKICTCENCGRTTESVELNKLVISGHVAHVCIMCAHVLSQGTNRERFFSLVRNKNVQSSNSEMQIIHQKLSAMILVGLFFIVCIAGFGVAQNINTFSEIPVQHAEQQIEYLTFAVLNRF
ncbi:DNA polymerase III subunit delta [Solibacillus sp. CAU 1738]|uniref:DNA polymerase III subunit delta n=1 Tax=Solibacillus sp. CAU 1738 TaxID=3140363 RepID=UPI0032615E57